MVLEYFLIVQINEYCKLHKGSTFHSMAQKILNISDFRGQRAPKLVLIFSSIEIEETE